MQSCLPVTPIMRRSTESNFIEMSAWLERQWQRISLWHLLLWPLSQVFRSLAALRRIAYRSGVLAVWQAPVPVIVVGNISVGGTGKTPLVLWLASFLKAHGYRPGIVSRGYGSNINIPRAVRATGSAADYGDEPLLLAQRIECPIWVGRHRTAVAQALLGAHPECNLLICDDGLQHYALARDIEVAVVGGKKSMGNGMLIPAGPLREFPERLRDVDAVVDSGEQGGLGGFEMKLAVSAFRNLNDSGRTATAPDFLNQTVHAVAGIGHPQRFFELLRKLGLHVQEHPYPDHYLYSGQDLLFENTDTVLMTEKDAVKCRAFARPNWWYLQVDAQIDPAFGECILNKLRS